MKKNTSLVLINAILILSGCTQYTPQNLNAHSDLNEMQFISKNNRIEDDLGRLYKQCKGIDKNGKEYLTNWSATSLILFPTGITGVNKIDTGPVKKDSYTAIEKSGAKAKAVLTGIFDGGVNYNSAYRYNAEVNQVISLQTSTLKFNKPAGDYITKHSNCNFAYLNTLYKGTAFIEVLKEVSSDTGGGNEAAFRIDGSYYQSDSANRFITGFILFELADISPDELEMLSSMKPSPDLIGALNAKEVSELKNIYPELKIDIK
ncbi:MULTISPECIES: hypothetical protein [Klebsiella]|uniref:hypothetical protein n=1 Tax=Klebsiella TaxID=570 RepID=UPI001BD4FBA7|nr:MULTISPECIES: hypothetical protein [Klebsiella]EKZ9669711.1 hypothetical protein [Klebsiella aerogenes]MDQ8579731.1 hypothetical protein [Klebsiella aerogenes]MDU9365545.1 hypothetical protein [Klebsiella sp. 141203]HBS5677300.1 hypothetical protein [Klebsiella aerogenes]HCR0140538.1 hypothetical protein [Klebsiella aerogenes]